MGAGTSTYLIRGHNSTHNRCRPPVDVSRSRGNHWTYKFFSMGIVRAFNMLNVHCESPGISVSNNMCNDSQTPVNNASVITELQSGLVFFRQYFENC